MNLDKQTRARAVTHGKVIPAVNVSDEPYTVTLRFRCVNALNSREHWAKRARRAKQQRALTFWLIDKWGVPRLPVTVTLTRLGPRVMDSDGLAASLKHVRDGVADVYKVDDGDARYVWRYAQEKSKTYGVRIDIRPIVAAHDISRPASHGRQLGRAK